VSIHRDMSFAAYLGSDAYGASDIRAAKFDSPASMKWHREHRDEEEVTDATRIGKAAHCAILTPRLFDESFVVKPEGMKFQSDANKALRDKWLAEGRTILTAKEWAQVDAVVRAFHSKAAASIALVQADAIEASVFWTDTETGVFRKCRPDFWGGGYVYDLKVSIDAEKGLDTLSYKAHANGWANQLAGGVAGLNANGVAVKGGRLVVIAPSPPQQFRVWLLELRENDLLFLEMDNQNTCRVIAECERTGQWPGTPDDWQVIELPASAAFNEADLEGAEEIPI
jgi:hypothetical protein